MTVQRGILVDQVLRIPVIKIGTSRGIRIPKKILDALHIGNEFIARICGNEIRLQPAKKPRQGWEKDFRRAHREGADRSEIPGNLDSHLWDSLDD
jgi:antitoxin MazE